MREREEEEEEEEGEREEKVNLGCRLSKISTVKWLMSTLASLTHLTRSS